MFERIGVHTSIAAGDEFTGEFGGQPINGLVITGANATASLAVRVRNKNGTLQLINNIPLGALSQIGQIRNGSELISATNTSLYVDLGFIDLSVGTLDYTLINGTVAVSAYTVNVVRKSHGIEHFKVFEATQDLNNTIDNCIRLYLMNPATALDTITVRNLNYSNMFNAGGTVGYATCLARTASTLSCGVCFDSEDGIPEKVSYSLTRTGASTAYTIAEKVYLNNSSSLRVRFQNETRAKLSQLAPAQSAALISASKQNLIAKSNI